MAIAFDDAGARFTISGVIIPPGDFTIVMAEKIDAAATGTFGYLISHGPTSNPHTSSNNFQLFGGSNGLWITGKDSGNRSIGTDVRVVPSQVGQRARWNGSRTTSGSQGPGIAQVHFVEHSGNWIRHYVMPLPGGRPTLVSEEYRNTWAGTTTQQMMCAIRRDIVSRTIGTLEAWGMVHFTLTEDQKIQVACGADPGSFGTTSGDDFFFTMAANAATLNSTFGAKTATRNGAAGYTTVGTILGTAVAQGVYVTARAHGHLFQYEFASGNASVSFDWFTRGTLGAGVDIQIKITDANGGATVVDWTTTNTNIASATGSGSVTIAKGLRWLNVQARKVISGTPQTEVGIVPVDFGIGITGQIEGQSLADHWFYTTGSSATYGSDVTPGGFVSARTQRYGGGVEEKGPITGCVNNGSGQGRVTLTGHGMMQGEIGEFQNIGGVTGCAGSFAVAVIDENTVDLPGSTFGGTFTSGGSMYRTGSWWARRYGDGAGGVVRLSNYLSTACSVPVGVTNRGLGGTPIAQFNDITKDGAATAKNEAIRIKADSLRLGFFLWHHGHADIGSSTYCKSSGSFPTSSGFGSLGTLFDLHDSYLGGAGATKYGVTSFTSISGNSSVGAVTVHALRRDMSDFIRRKKAAGLSHFFYGGDHFDMPPIDETSGSLVQNAHMYPGATQHAGARAGKAIAFAFGAGSSPRGPLIASCERTGNVIDVTVTPGDGTALVTPAAHGKITGFEVSLTNFGALLPITSVAVFSATVIRITLVSNPGADVYVRYAYGYPGNYSTSTYFTPQITNAANNGSGLVRLTAGATGTSPAHGLATGDPYWVRGANARGVTGTDGRGLVTTIDASNVDLQGTTFGGAFTPAGNYFPDIERTMANPVYDNQAIGPAATGDLPTGLPVQFTDVPLLTNAPAAPPPPPPVITSFTVSPLTVTTGQTVSGLVNVSVSGDSTLTTIDYDGNGIPDATVTPGVVDTSYSYATAGTYTPSATSSGPGGSDTEPATVVTVTGAPLPPPPPPPGPPPPPPPLARGRVFGGSINLG